MKKILFLAAALLILSAACNRGNQIKEDNTMVPPQSQDQMDEQYYSELEQQCNGSASKSCCLSSVNSMKSGKFKKAENNSCPEGHQINQNKCMDSFAWCEPNKLPQGEKTGWQTYASADYGFEIKYPNNFALYTGSAINDARNISYIPVCYSQDSQGCLMYIGSENLNTNFEAAGVSVNILQNLSTAAQCHSMEGVTGRQQAINGVNFYLFVTDGAATGHRQDKKSYRAFQNNRCYEIVTAVSSSDISFYEPGTKKEFNPIPVWQKLEEVLSTFKISIGISANSLQKICPDRWVYDKSRGSGWKFGGLPSEYMVIDGEEYYLDKIDVVWVKKNCKINSPEYVD